MKRSSALVLASFMAGLTALAVACGEDETTGTPAGVDGGSSGKDGGGSSSGDDDDDDTPNPDGGAEGEEDAGDSCIGQFEAPTLDGPGPCGTTGFGEPAAGFGPVDENAGATYSGTMLADGIYDAVNAERASGSSNGSWRETFVVKGNRFTRIRQVDLGTGSGPGPIAYRSGTFAYDVSDAGQLIKLTYDCAQTGDGGVDAGVDNLPSDAVVAADCSARYRYGATGIRVTLRRR